MEELCDIDQTSKHHIVFFSFNEIGFYWDAHFISFGPETYDQLPIAKAARGLHPDSFNNLIVYYGNHAHLVSSYSQYLC